MAVLLMIGMIGSFSFFYFTNKRTSQPSISSSLKKDPSEQRIAPFNENVQINDAKAIERKNKKKKFELKRKAKELELQAKVQGTETKKMEEKLKKEQLDNEKKREQEELKRKNAEIAKKREAEEKERIRREKEAEALKLIEQMDKEHEEKRQREDLEQQKLDAIQQERLNEILKKRQENLLEKKARKTVASGSGFSSSSEVKKPTGSGTSSGSASEPIKKKTKKVIKTLRPYNTTLIPPQTIHKILLSTLDKILIPLKVEQLFENFHEILYTIFRLWLSPNTRDAAKKVYQTLIVPHREEIEHFVNEPINEQKKKIVTRIDLLKRLRFIMGYAENVYFSKIFSLTPSAQLSFEKVISGVPKVNITNQVMKKVFKLTEVDKKSTADLYEHLKRVESHERDPTGKLTIKVDKNDEFVALEEEIEHIFDRVQKAFAEFYDFVRGGFHVPNFAMDEFFEWANQLRKFYSVIPVKIKLPRVGQEGFDLKTNNKVASVLYETYREMIQFVVTFVRVQTDHSLWKVKMPLEEEILLKSISPAIDHHDIPVLSHILEVLKSIGVDEQNKEFLNGVNFLLEKVAKKGSWESTMENTVSTSCAAMIALIDQKAYQTESKEQFASLSSFEEKLKKMGLLK